MAANLSIQFESGMIVILLTAPRLVKPLAHKLLRQLLGHSLPHAHDPVTEHFADGLVLPQPTHLEAHRTVTDNSHLSCKQTSNSSWPSPADILSPDTALSFQPRWDPLTRQSCCSTCMLVLSKSQSGDASLQDTHGRRVHRISCEFSTWLHCSPYQSC